jgi:hypothetical protein
MSKEDAKLDMKSEMVKPFLNKDVRYSWRNWRIYG